MALPLLHVSEIARQFERLRQQGGSIDLRALFEYICITWIQSEIWPPAAWSALRHPVRTNNDVEGWHNRLNRRARCII